MDGAIRIGAMIASVILFCLFLYLILSGASEAQFIAVLVLLVFAVLATRLDDIAKLSVGATGVAADLTQKLREAEASIEQLQLIAELFARLSVNQISGSDRMGGLTPQEKREQIEAIEAGLSAVGVSTAKIESVLALQDQFHNFDYYHWTMDGVWHASDERIRKARDEFKETWPDNGLGSEPPPAAVEEFLDTLGIKRGEITERLADWKQYEANRTHRRLEIWEDRHTSGKITELDALLGG